MHDLIQFNAAAPAAEAPALGEWRVLIAEDAAEHADALVECLKRLRPLWVVAAVVSDTQSLLQAIDTVVPNLLLLDVHLVGGRSIDVVAQLPYPVPIIFTTGDPAFAAKAYDCAALDYVLKPVRAARLERALRRAELFAPSGPVTDVAASQAPAWLMAHRGAGQLVVQCKDILYLQARGKLTLLVLSDGDAYIKRGLGLVEMQLDKAQFKRIHRSTIINVEHASAVVRDELGRMRLSIKRRDGWLDVSQPFEHLFRQT